MRELLWANVSHLSALLVTLSFGAQLCFTLATKGAYAKPRGLALILGLAWFSMLLWAVYAYPGLGPFAAAMTVTLFADSYTHAALAACVGQEVFHSRVVELLRCGGVTRYLLASLGSRLLHLALAVLLVGLSAGPVDWVYWAALGLASAQVLAMVSVVYFALKHGRATGAAA